MKCTYINGFDTKLYTIGRDKEGRKIIVIPEDDRNKEYKQVWVNNTRKRGDTLQGLLKETNHYQKRASTTDVQIFIIERDKEGRKIIVIPEKFAKLREGDQVRLGFGRISEETLKYVNLRRRKSYGDCKRLWIKKEKKRKSKLKNKV